MHKRTKSLGISDKTRKTVYERDNYCILCGLQGTDMAHYISRAQGGLGIPENIVYLCRDCHMALDGVYRKEYKELVKEYLDKHYPDFQDSERVYKK